MCIRDRGADPGLEKDGVEAHLQQLLAEKPEVLEAGLTLLRREYPTDIGPVDLLCRSEDGETVAVEIKRRGELDGVEQLTRYLERLGHDSRLHPLRGIFVAQLIAPQAKVLAEARGIRCVEVDYEELRGILRDLLGNGDTGARKRDRVVEAKERRLREELMPMRDGDGAFIIDPDSLD